VFTIECPGCTYAVRVTDTAVGQVVLCSQCGQELTVAVPKRSSQKRLSPRQWHDRRFWWLIGILAILTAILVVSSKLKQWAALEERDRLLKPAQIDRAPR
jgi:hypothetical protein